MPIEITYFVHGTSTDNENGISSGWHDSELSPLGIEQSKVLARKTADMQFDTVFCSDLKRARDSANITWGEIYPIIEDNRLRECNYGDYTAKPSEIVEPLLEKSILNPMPNGESCENVQKRLASFLNDLNNNYAGKHIAIVAHRAPQLALDVLLNNMSWESAFDNDWRKTKSWQPGWKYTM